MYVTFTWIINNFNFVLLYYAIVDNGTSIYSLPSNGNMTSHISSPDRQYSTLSNKTSDKLTIKKTKGQ